ncbi:prepilin-type N-terminal cleavage/methylation domain-containing protein [Microcoleus sp. w1-18aA5]|uniref:prepilin-type N-terminal cleavage/methylation domain-containing protein n=1 Tax=Microcoleus sp. w1-18aA5 TaxID=2818982 RepID=UPI002FD74076
MKTPILLKVLPISATKANPNFKKTASRKGDQGFTLLEVLVIALIVGILSSIAAPSWVAFINRQRVRTVNDRVLQTLRTAQSEAKRTKRDITVTFNPTDPPTLTINPTNPATNPPVQTALTTTPPIQTVTFDGGGEIKPGTITLLTNKPLPSITFNYQGNITSPSIQSSTPRQTTDGFTVTVAPARGGAKQCVIVETILGAMRTDEGTFNTSTGQGCP